MSQSANAKQQPSLQLVESGGRAALSQSKPVWIVTAIWFGLATWLAIGGTFDAPAGDAPLAMIAAAGVPPVLFWIAYLVIRRRGASV